MKFFILGDSWGVGEWDKSTGIFESVPNSGLDYYLTQAGHTVMNIAQGSAGNFGQLRHAYWTLDQYCDLFPDNAHPSRQCYRALAQKILKLC